jgi:hypothetical protein
LIDSCSCPILSIACWSLGDRCKSVHKTRISARSAKIALIASPWILELALVAGFLVLELIAPSSWSTAVLGAPLQEAGAAPGRPSPAPAGRNAVEDPQG